MDDLQQIRANLRKIRELDHQLEQHEREEQTSTAKVSPELMEPGSIEFALLLEEMEMQQEIGRKLRTENQQLQRKLETGKLKYEQTRDEIANYSDSQNAALDKQKREMESEQNAHDLNSQKEEGRLKKTIEILEAKNANLIQERNQLRKKLETMRTSLGHEKKKKIVRKPK